MIIDSALLITLGHVGTFRITVDQHFAFRIGWFLITQIGHQSTHTILEAGSKEFWINCDKTMSLFGDCVRFSESLRFRLYQVGLVRIGGPVAYIGSHIGSSQHRGENLHHRSQAIALVATCTERIKKKISLGRYWTHWRILHHPTEAVHDIDSVW